MLGSMHRAIRWRKRLPMAVADDLASRDLRFVADRIAHGSAWRFDSITDDRPADRITSRSRKESFRHSVALCPPRLLHLSNATRPHRLASPALFGEHHDNCEALRVYDPHRVRGRAIRARWKSRRSHRRQSRHGRERLAGRTARSANLHQGARWKMADLDHKNAAGPRKCRTV